MSPPTLQTQPWFEWVVTIVIPAVVLLALDAEWLAVNEAAIETRLQIGTVMLNVTLLFCAAGNYLMARRQACRSTRRRAKPTHPRRSRLQRS